MAGKMRVFMLLLQKNFLVRKKHWIQSTIIQVFIPIFLILLGQTVRLMTDNHPIRIPDNTYHEIKTQASLKDEISLNTFIRFTPHNNLTAALMEDTRNCLGLLSAKVVGSSDEDTMIAELHHDQSSEGGLAELIGVVFETIQNETLPKKFKYKFRISGILPTDLYDPDENGNLANTAFHSIPLVQTQLCLDEAYIAKAQPAPRFSYEMSIQQMPYPPYIHVDKATAIGGDVFAELARLAFLIVLCIEVSFPANEKHIGINILMSVNGVKNHVNLFSWLVSGAIYSTMYLMPMVLILKHFMPPAVVPFLSYGNAFILWLALFFHICHVIAFGFHLTSYFWKPSHGIFAAFMFITLMNILATYVHGPRVEEFFLYLGVLSPNFLLKGIFAEVTAYESKLIGVKWSNLFIAGKSGSSSEASIGVMMIFSILGIIFHFFMTVYVYEIRPGKYGIRRGPLYFFQRRKNNKVTIDDKKVDFEKTKPTKREFETVPEGSLEPGIRIRSLKKTYTTDFFRKTNVYALRGVSMDFYKSQITALLGHNGAGKTTMMSILSGLTDATDGIVFIDGKNIQHNPDAISNNIGLCPQENMVFPDLNVQQQLMFFGTLKAKTKTKRQLEHEIEVLLAKVNLTDKRTALPNELSGGQKRRLCLAMAVIGDGNVLILDEPTSGMDAESKREVWDIVLKMRGEKTIIISTHDMEEADILGDRIAIMHTGKLKSYGTSMFLKKLYGDGQVEVTLSIEPWCDLTKIFEEIGTTAQVLSQDEGKVVMAIPVAQSLPKALDKLEVSKKKLGITGISVSIITLEQVFLRVTRDDVDEVDSNDQIKSFQQVTGFRYYIQTFLAFLVKKITFSRKNPWTFWISLLLPCAAAILMLFQFGISSGGDKPMSLTLNAYSRPRAMIRSEKAILENMYKTTIESYHGTPIVLSPTNISMTEALLNFANEDVGQYRDKMIVAGEFNGSGQGVVKANGFYSGSALLSIPITINCLSNALVKTLANDDEHSIEISVQTIPDTTTFQSGQPDVAFTFTLSMLVFLGPALAMYVTQPLQESLSGLKQLQNMTGAPKLMYWASMYCFDLVQYIISILLLLSSFIIVDISLGSQLYHGKEILITIALLLLFGISVLPFIYLSSFLKKSINATINILSVAPLVLGFVEMILVLVTLTADNQAYKIFRKIQSKIFLLVPHLGLTYGHVSFFEIVVRNARCRRMPDHLLVVSCISGDPCCFMKCSNGTCQKPLPYFVPQEFFPSLETSMIFLALSSVLFFILIFILEQQYVSKLWVKIRKNNQAIDTSGLDEMVLKENQIVAEDISMRMYGRRIEDTETENVFLVDRLKKSYGKFQAVKGISFRVKEGECFGLLGVNGAGKSTSFRMLTGAEIPQAGVMYLKDYNIATNRVKYLAEMGYCPQQDAIIDSLNAWDHLYLFARLRGIPKNQIHSTVKKWIIKLNLTACAGQPSGTYSGGNKRRLNIAMALIGNPSLVLMDEPTTGVDPAARRSLWNTLKSCQDAGQSIILTSHSMEECEVLCNRLVIMVKGQLVCVGASQELKQRFGAGYNIHVKLSPNRSYADVQGIKQHIESKLTCKLSDENTGFIGYHITDPKATWTIMYTMMNELKSNYSCIEDFAVLSSTLEQLFIQFARGANGCMCTDDSTDLANGTARNERQEQVDTGSAV